MNFDERQSQIPNPKSQIDCVLLDIEGTTTPIDFVHKILFPFARERMSDYMDKNFTALSGEIRQLQDEYAADLAQGNDPPEFDAASPSSVARYLRFLIDVDRKSSPLKAIQGRIWQSGYESGSLKSIVFEDVPRAFERWREKGITIAIYSSGSVLAQKLIFKYSAGGDLTPCISGYFDTAVGHKRDAASYRKITSTPGFPPAENSLFISDIPEELDAAAFAGFQTLLSVREGNVSASADIHQPIHNFDVVLP